jgi:predicted transcriptional regulator
VAPKLTNWGHKQIVFDPFWSERVSLFCFQRRVYNEATSATLFKGLKMPNDLIKTENFAKPSKFGSATISLIAENTAAQLGYFEDFDIGKVVNKLGGKIEIRDFWGLSQHGGLEVQSPKSFSIFVPTHTPIERDKFTIAHELGHFVLHYLLSSEPSVKASEFQASRYGDGLVEVEANGFAGSFLMPKEQFLASFYERKGNLFAVARMFGVSRKAAEVRAKVLGILVAENES